MRIITAIGMAAVLAGCSAQAAPSSGRHEGPLVTEDTAKASPPARPIAGRLVFVDFSSPDHGIALIGQCTQKPFRCKQRIAALDDGWRLRNSPLPDLTNPEAGFSAELIALTPGRAILITGPDNLTGSKQWFTRDAARSWREVSAVPVGKIATIPTGARLRVDGGLVTVIDPGTGLRKVLAQPPPLSELHQPAGIPAYDGSWWITGTDRKTGATAVAVSRNAGRTWTVSRLGSLPKAWHTRVLVSPDAVYVTLNGQVPAKEAVKNGLLAILRSTDRGRTWQLMWSYRPGREPVSNTGTVLASDGTLRVVAELRGTYVSRDGGRSFTWSDNRTGWVNQTRGGYLITVDDERRYLVSTDGLTWRVVTVTT